jgi:hypothetical protein
MRPDRHRTRRHRWRRHQTLWRRLPVRLPHPAYGVLAAAALGAVVVLVIGIATVRALDTPTTSAATSNQPTTPLTPADAPTSPTGATTAPTPTRLPTTTGLRAEATEWALTLRALDAQRAHAFWTLDQDILDRIYVPGSQPWQADRALLATYRKQQVRVQGLRIQIDKTTIAHQTPTTVTLKTTDHLTAGQAIDHTGTSTPLPPGTPTTRLITLTKTPAPRITTITPA